MFGKFFASTFTGSMVGAGLNVFGVWGYVIANTRADGHVELNPPLIAAALGCTVPEVEKAIVYLSATDTKSRNKKEGGRRLIQKSEFLYFVTTYLDYRRIKDNEDRNNYMRDYMREYRKPVLNANVNKCKPPLAQAEAEAEAEENNTVSPSADGVGDDVQISYGNTTEEDTGFGVATKVTPPNTFDTEMATILETAVRKLPARKTGIQKSKPSTWAKHFRLLRCIDGVVEKDISRVLKWYAAHIGEEFVPWAYSGETFRKKWVSLFTAAGRDRTAVEEITPRAAAVAKRLLMLGWPRGSAVAVSGAVQACLTAYAEWRVRRNAFMVQLESGDLDMDAKESTRLITFGTYVSTQLVSGDHFVEEWLRDVHGQVHGWAGWSGDLSRYVFSPTAKRFTAMGRGWAQAFCGNPARWDNYIAQMGKEE